MSTNNNSDKDIFDSLKKKFYRSGYADKYGGSIFSCLVIIITIVLLTIYFGTKNDFYESENYKGDGCAHDVKR